LGIHGVDCCRNKDNAVKLIQTREYRIFTLLLKLVAIDLPGNVKHSYNSAHIAPVMFRLKKKAALEAAKADVLITVQRDSEVGYDGRWMRLLLLLLA